MAVHPQVDRRRPDRHRRGSRGGPALAALTGTYTIDPAHSSIGFTVRHAMVTNVRGSFGEHEGTLTLDGTDPANSSAAST